MVIYPQQARFLQYYTGLDNVFQKQYQRDYFLIILWRTSLAVKEKYFKIGKFIIYMNKVEYMN